VSAVIAAVALAIGCAKEREINPKPVDYTLLVADPVALSVFYIDPKTYTVVDSLWSIGSMFEPSISPDGRWIYLSTEFDGFRHTPGLYKFDLDTKQHTSFLGTPAGFLSRGEFALVADGGLLIEGFDSLNLISPEDLTITGSRPIRLSTPHGARGSDLVVGGAFGNYLSFYLGIYDYRRSTFDSILVGSNGYVYESYIHPDGRRVFVWDGNVLSVVDLLTRSVTRRPGVMGGTVHVVFDRSGDRAFVAYGHSWGIDGPCPEGKVWVIDCTRADYPIVDSLIFPGQEARSVALSPDETRLYIGLEINSCQLGRILVVNPDSLADSLGAITHGTINNPEWLLIRE
jgi:hypothetical protein